MFDKNFLVHKLVNSLQKREYKVLTTEGAFDVAAKRENLLLLKVLLNIDSLKEEQALSLRAVAHFTSAYPFIISLHNNRRILEKNVVYSRFEIPVVVPELFEAIIDEEAEVLHSAKGRYTTEIDSRKLRERRIELKLTLEKLAELVGISKKALYEIEKSKVNPTKETARRLEVALSIKLRKNYEARPISETILKPRTALQKEVHKEFCRIGIKNSPVYFGPIELVGRERFSLISLLSKNIEKLRREVTLVRKLSRIFSSKAVFVVRETRAQNIGGVPVFSEEELPEIKNLNEFKKIIEEKAEASSDNV
jgi:putative transcriptional regulator